MTSLYRPILKQAWSHTWHNKFLWFFGFFAAWLGTSGEYELILRSFDRINEKGSLMLGLNDFAATTGLFSAVAEQNMKQLITTHPLALLPIIIIALILLLAVIFVIWTVMVSQGGLVSSLKRIAGGKTTNLQEGLIAGIGKFWPILWLNLIYRLAVFVLFLGLGAALGLFFNSSFINANDLSYFLTFFIGFVIFIPLVIIVSFVARYAICYAVINNYRLKEAIKQGLALFFKNWLISLELAFILLILYAIMAVLMALALLAAITPLIFLLAIFYAIGLAWAFKFFTFLTLVAFAGLVIVVVSLFSTYLWSAWTLLFIQLTEKGGESKLIRLAQSLPGVKRRLA
ncbi:MAG: hypothetical protein V1684_00300 [bacterium]